MIPLDRATDAYLRHVAVERGLSQHTVAAYRRDLAVFAEWLASTPTIDSAGTDRAGGAAALTDVARLTRADVAGFVTHLTSRPEQPLPPPAVGRILS